MIPCIGRKRKGTGKHGKDEGKNNGKTSGGQAMNIPDEKQRSFESVGVKRQGVHKVGEQTGDDILMFAICNLRATIQNTHATNTILSITQS